MGKAIPPEIRGKIIAFHEAGMSHRWIVRETSTSLSSVQRFIRLYREDKGRGLLPQGVPVAKKQVDFFSVQKVMAGSSANNIVHVTCSLQWF